MNEDNWETQEVITWLINDEGAFIALQGLDADEIREWVINGEAPQGLYDSFKQPPKSSFKDVDWDSVEDSVNN